jgi:hypothetical protein
MRNPGLKTLQRGLGACIGGRSARLFKLEWIESSAQATASERLEIYANAYFERILEALQTDFPATALAAGEGFASLVARYLMAHAPRGASISEAGRGLADFLARQKQVKPWLSELARLEWAALEAYFADGGSKPTAKALEGIAEREWPRARLELSPSVRLLSTRYPVGDLWRLRADPDSFLKAARTCRARPRALGYCLWRMPGASTVTCMKLDPAAALLLGAFARKKSLGSALRTLKKRDLPPPERIQSWFSAWISGGVIAKISDRKP